MAKPTVVASTEVVAKGGVLEISYDGGTTFEKPPGIQEIPDFGSDTSFTNVDAADETVMRYIAGIPAPKSLELVYRRIGDNVEQDNLIAAADARKTVRLKVTYQSGDIRESDAVLGEHYMGSVGDGDDVQMFGIPAQLSGAITPSKVA